MNKDATVHWPWNKSCFPALSVLRSHWYWLWPYFLTNFPRKIKWEKQYMNHWETGSFYLSHIYERKRGRWLIWKHKTTGQAFSPMFKFSYHSHRYHLQAQTQQTSPSPEEKTKPETGLPPGGGWPNRPQVSRHILGNQKSLTSVLLALELAIWLLDAAWEGTSSMCL